MPRLDLKAFLSVPDLEAGVLRAASSRPFEDEPLRILAAFRVASELGLEPDPKTRDLFRTRRSLLREVPTKDIREEFLEILAGPDCARQLRLMDECRILTVLFPELEPGRRCAVEYYGQGGVLTHTLAALSRGGFLFDHLAEVFPGLAQGRQVPGASPSSTPRRRALFMLTVLLHDIAKPSTARRIKGRLRFFGHDAKGALAASRVMRRLRFPKGEIAEVAEVIRHHLRPGNLAASGKVTERACRRFFQDTGKAAFSLLLTAWADHASYLAEEILIEHLPLMASWTRGKGTMEAGFQAPPGMDKDTAKTLRHLWTVSILLAGLLARPSSPLERLVNGNDVMRALDLKPGPSVGKVLGEVDRAQAAGRLADRKEALAFLSGLRLKQRRNKISSS
ncbi:MAG: HD domain-containing protein [Elusimicrobia bacterium]|nr:HD domain-containing protein [Elusimicrobiota bacterium]